VARAALGNPAVRESVGRHFPDLAIDMRVTA
jgi:hypothetical protein